MANDYGFAPNPFGKVCSLATCKPKIRKNAGIGDWVIGTGSKGMGLKYHLIYLMEVTNKLSFKEYWEATEFQFKKPIPNGGLLRIHGDNIYYKNDADEFMQLESLHTNEDGSQNEKHVKRDTKGKFVLLSNNFYYFGEKNFLLPEKFFPICSHVRDTFIIKDKKLAAEFVDWVQDNYKKGINGFPINWKEYQQLKMVFS